MKLLRAIIVSSVFLMVLAIPACQKEEFQSRDTSGLKPPPPEPPPPVDPTLVSFDPAEALDDWEIAGPGPKNVDKTNKKQGDASLMTAIVTGEDYMHFIKRRPAPVDPKLSEADGQFVFWFYVSNIADLKDNDGQIELTSSGQSDKNEYSWNLSGIIPNLQTGWNEIALNFSDAAKGGDGGPDIHSFNFFRIYFWTKDKAHADVQVGVDDLRFRKIPAPPPGLSVMFDPADAMDDWEIAGPGPKNVDKTDKKEGVASLSTAIITGEDYMHFIKRKPAIVDPGFTESEGQFKFWFYVERVADLKLDGQIELTSSGQSDKNEYSWNLDAIIPTLHDGWNDVTLNFSAANKGGDGGPDIHKFNFFRMYFWTNDKTHTDLKVAVDYLRFTKRQTVSLSFDPAESLDDWEIAGPGPKNVDKTDKKEGTASLTSAIMSGEDYIHFIKRRPTAVNSPLTKDNGQLKFWFYVERAADLKLDGQIELTSAGESDKKEYSWNLETIIPTLHDGWNELLLDFSTANLSGDGGPDVAAFNFFRIYFWTKDKTHADMKVGVDDIRIVEK